MQLCDKLVVLENTCVCRSCDKLVGCSDILTQQDGGEAVIY